MTQTKSIMTLGLLLGVVTACGQASDPVEPEAPSPPINVANVEAPAEPETEPEAIVEVTAPEEDDDHDHDDDHAHDHEDEHAHDHDDEHDHDHEHTHDDDHRHGGEAHVHGAAEFVLATTETGAEAEFRSPLYNLVGFEHEPQTPEQTAAMDAVIAQLADSTVLFMPSEDAGCATIDYTIDVERDGDHGALTASYLMTCQDIGQIEAIDLTAFATYANIESVDVVFVGADSQSAGTATKDAPNFAIGG